MPDSALAFGIDLSKFNTSADGKKKVDFDLIAAHLPRVEFIAMRAGISWAYQDPWFNFYFAEGQRIGRVLMPYHVLYPGENPITQMDNFFRILGDINFKITPLVLDLELDHGQSVSTITKTTAQCVDLIFKRTGRVPIIYSRASWVNQFLQVADLPLTFWWLAQYLYSRPYPLYTPEFPSPPVMPRFVHHWLIHQTTQRGRSIGAPGLHYMDYNRFNGDALALVKFAYDALPENQPVTCPVDQQSCDGSRTQPLSPSPTLRAHLSQAGRCDPTGKPPVGASRSKTPAGSPEPRRSPAWLVHKTKQSPLNLDKDLNNHGNSNNTF